MRFTLLLLPFLLLSACAADETASGDEPAADDTITVVDDANAGMTEPSSAAATVDGTVYTLRSAQVGDVACYLDFEDETGATIGDAASFPMCDKEDLIGQRVTVTHEMQDVIADSCQGDPECTESQSVSLITAMEPAE